jgi:hypothetical protein
MYYVYGLHLHLESTKMTRNGNKCYSRPARLSVASRSLRARSAHHTLRFLGERSANVCTVQTSVFSFEPPCLSRYSDGLQFVKGRESEVKEGGAVALLPHVPSWPGA